MNRVLVRSRRSDEPVQMHSSNSGCWQNDQPATVGWTVSRWMRLRYRGVQCKGCCLANVGEDASTLTGLVALGDGVLFDQVVEDEWVVAPGSVLEHPSEDEAGPFPDDPLMYPKSV